MKKPLQDLPTQEKPPSKHSDMFHLLLLVLMLGFTATFLVLAIIEKEAA